MACWWESVSSQIKNPRVLKLLLILARHVRDNQIGVSLLLRVQRSSQEVDQQDLADDFDQPGDAHV